MWTPVSEWHVRDVVLIHLSLARLDRLLDRSSSPPLVLLLVFMVILTQLDIFVVNVVISADVSLIGDRIRTYGEAFLS